jgi:hypothetical protein
MLDFTSPVVYIPVHLPKGFCTRKILSDAAFVPRLRKNPERSLSTKQMNFIDSTALGHDPAKK